MSLQALSEKEGKGINTQYRIKFQNESPKWITIHSVNALFNDSCLQSSLRTATRNYSKLLSLPRDVITNIGCYIPEWFEVSFSPGRGQTSNPETMIINNDETRAISNGRKNIEWLRLKKMGAPMGLNWERKDAPPHVRRIMDRKASKSAFRMRKKRSRKLKRRKRKSRRRKSKRKSLKRRSRRCKKTTKIKLDNKIYRSLNAFKKDH